MYLWDSNIVRAFGEGHSTLRLYLEQISWADIALPPVVVAEVLRGRCEFALKAAPSQAPQAHALLQKTRQMIQEFQVIVFDHTSANLLDTLLTQHRHRKRYADVMIAAMGPGRTAYRGYSQPQAFLRFAFANAIDKLDRFGITKNSST